MSNGDVESVETVWVQGDDGVEREEALELLRRGTEFHLLLTDVMMPGVDGPALLQIVRNDERLRDMPVVMMSANEHSETVFRCIQYGAEDYLLKPVSRKAVMHMWQHVWRKSHAQMARAVPRFENGEEVLDDEEDHRGELAHGVRRFQNTPVLRARRRIPSTTRGRAKTSRRSRRHRA